MNNFRYSQAGLALAKRFESCKLTAYQDSRGIWACGWGSTGPDVVEGAVWTQEYADARALADTALAAVTVNRVVTFAINQNEFDALVEFAYQGRGAFESSTPLKLLNAGDVVGAAAQFQLIAGGQVVAGLLRRRLAEVSE